MHFRRVRAGRHRLPKEVRPCSPGAGSGGRDRRHFAPFAHGRRSWAGEGAQSRRLRVSGTAGLPRQLEEGTPAFGIAVRLSSCELP